jgi:hypothetical protein
MSTIISLPIERDDTAPDLIQIGHMCATSIDPATSRLLGSITYDQKHGFNLEWDSKEAFKDWLDNLSMCVQQNRQPQTIPKEDDAETED